MMEMINILYLYQPFLTFCLFFYIQRHRAMKISIAYLIVNLMGISTYYIYPAAPPWYVANFGLGLQDILPRAEALKPAKEVEELSS